jgi:hypothetical protein
MSEERVLIYRGPTLPKEEAIRHRHDPNTRSL